MASAIDGNKLASRPRLGKFESGDGRPLQVAHALNEYPGNTGEVSGVAQERAIIQPGRMVEIMGAEAGAGENVRAVAPFLRKGRNALRADRARLPQVPL